MNTHRLGSVLLLMLLVPALVALAAEKDLYGDPLPEGSFPFHHRAAGARLAGDDGLHAGGVAAGGDAGAERRAHQRAAIAIVPDWPRSSLGSTGVLDQQHSLDQGLAA